MKKKLYEAPQLAVVYLKAERAHKMKRSTRRRAGAGDVARVGRDLRLVQYDMQHGISPRAAIFRPMTQTRAIL